MDSACLRCWTVMDFPFWRTVYLDLGRLVYLQHVPRNRSPSFDRLCEVNERKVSFFRKQEAQNPVVASLYSEAKTNTKQECYLPILCKINVWSLIMALSRIIDSRILTPAWMFTFSPIDTFGPNWKSSSSYSTRKWLIMRLKGKKVNVNLP